MSTTARSGPPPDRPAAPRPAAASRVAALADPDRRRVHCHPAVLARAVWHHADEGELRRLIPAGEPEQGREPDIGVERVDHRHLPLDVPGRQELHLAVPDRCRGSGYGVPDRGEEPGAGAAVQSHRHPQLVRFGTPVLPAVAVVRRLLHLHRPRRPARSRRPRWSRRHDGRRPLAGSRHRHRATRHHLC